MNILICPDKFKGSLTAGQVGAAIKQGIQQQLPAATIRIHPMADGGDGSLAVLAAALKLQAVAVPTLDPLNRPIQANYYHDGTSAYIELAAASGITLLDSLELDPLNTSTFGTGLQLQHAMEQGFRHVYLFLGGSATHDLGFGIAATLGYQFRSSNGNEIVPTGGNLGKLASIVPSKNDRLNGFKLTMLCDVRNPLLGPNGAAAIYAPQKGANTAQVQFLEDGSQSSSILIEQFTGKHISTLIGGGAAGGVAAGLVGLLHAELRSGFTTISELTGLDAAIEQADLVISGEGKLDGQSLEGKVVSGVATLCSKHHKPLHLFTGDTDLSLEELAQLSVSSLQTVLSQAKDLEDAIDNAATYLRKIAVSWAKTI